MSHLFISHVNQDEATARELARGLEAAGFASWFYERDSVAGPSYIEQIIDAIKSSWAILLIISPDAVKSSQVDAEVIEGFEGRKPFIPLLKDISYQEFFERKPSWKMPLRAAVALPIVPGQVAEQLPRILGGLKMMGFEPQGANQPPPLPVEPPPPPASGLTIPRPLLGTSAPGSVLQLTPVATGSARAWRLVARPVFKIGRSRQVADYAAWFWPRNAANDEKTARLGKVHALLEMTREGLAIRDGDGEKPSANGSQYGGTRLAPRDGTPVGERGELLLGGDYRLEIAAHLLPEKAVLSIANLGEWRGSAGQERPLRGFVKFRPLNTEPMPPEVIWMLSEAPIGTGLANALVLDLPELAEVAGRFHFLRGCFWLESRSAGDKLRVDGTPLRLGEIAPLAPDQLLHIGSARYLVQLET